MQRKTAPSSPLIVCSPAQERKKRTRSPHGRSPSVLPLNRCVVCDAGASSTVWGHWAPPLWPRHARGRGSLSSRAGGGTAGRRPPGTSLSREAPLPRRASPPPAPRPCDANAPDGGPARLGSCPSGGIGGIHASGAAPLLCDAGAKRGEGGRPPPMAPELEAHALVQDPTIPPAPAPGPPPIAPAHLPLSSQLNNLASWSVGRARACPDGARRDSY